MPDPKAPGVEVNANAGLLDSLAAAGRLVLVIVGAVPILLKLLGAHDFVALAAYFHSSDGATLIASVSALAALGYGIYKSHKRGAEIARVAANPKVPDSVAKIK